MPRVLHLARRPLNGHPGWLAELQRRQGWDAKVCLLNGRETAQRPYPNDLVHTDKAAVAEFAAGANVLHLHDDLTLNDRHASDVYAMLADTAVVVQQYYHERSSIHVSLQRRTRGSDEFECVIAKKAAILEPNLPRLPVVVPHWRSELKPAPRRKEKLRLAFTPTTTQRMLSYFGTRGKGYAESKVILDRMSKYLDIDIITNLPWKGTMERCADADIRLDELVTGGFGQATLEGLSHGVITISGMNDAAEALLPASFPGFKATVESLEAVVFRILGMTWAERQHLAQAGPEWIAANYSEAMLHGAYEAFYRRCCEQFLGSPTALDDRIVTMIAVAPPRLSYNTLARIPAPKPETESGKTIVQVSRTNCAGAIWRLHDVINQYTPHTCRTITFASITNGRRYRKDILFGETRAVAEALAKADVVHFHNFIDPHAVELLPFRQHLRGKKMVLQYHTEPKFVQTAFPGVDVVNRTDVPTLVIAQKHTRFYPKSRPVPNLIDVDTQVMTPSTRKWMPGSPLKVIYTPTDTKTYPDYRKTCSGKGYQETMPILHKLEKEGVIALTVITDMAWEDLMPIKRMHDVCIDECVTGGYHLCSLEALSQGLITVAWLDKDTQAAIAHVVGKQTELPWLNTPLAALEEALRNLAKQPASLIYAMKERSRRWMLDHWHPKKMVRHFLSAYDVTETDVVCREFPTNTAPLPVYNVEPSIGDDLRALAGTWTSKQVVIWGNGPTANDAARDKPWKEGAKHIGTNAAVKLGLSFDAYCIGDLRFVRDEAKRAIALTCPGVRVFQAHLRTALPNDLQVNYVRTVGNDGFCSDLVKGVYHGYSVVWLALQVAAYAGAKEVLLAGCGHDYSGAKPRFYAEDKPAEIDRNTERIIANYRRVLPVLASLGITLKTIGPSRLSEAGVPVA